MPFQELSKRKRKDVKVEDIQVRVCLFGFDLLYLNGEVRIYLCDCEHDLGLFNGGHAISRCCIKTWLNGESSCNNIFSRSMGSLRSPIHPTMNLPKISRRSWTRVSRTGAKA